MENPLQSSQSLPMFPPVRPTSANKSTAFNPGEEGTRIVGTAKKSTRPLSSSGLRDQDNYEQNTFHSDLKDNNPQLHKWTHQRLQSEGAENTKVGWENEIARHILSVYASTNTQKNLKESHNLLDFVGDRTQQKNKTKKKPTKKASKQDEEEEEEDQLVYAVPQFHQNYNDHLQRFNMDADHGHTKHHKRLHPHDNGNEETEVSELEGKDNTANSIDKDNTIANEEENYHEDDFQQQPYQGKNQDQQEDTNNVSNTDDNNLSKKKVVKKKKKMKKVVKTLPLHTPLTAKEKQLEEKRQAEQHYNQRCIATLLDKIALHSAGLTESQRQYRVNNTIKLRDGSEITVRGPPKVTPIWFCSSGDVFCDWTALPGGKRLQAHLSLMYEQNLFVEYLQLLQMLLLRLYRRAAYGEETFTAGSFGLEERYGQTRVPPAHIKTSTNNLSSSTNRHNNSSSNTNNNSKNNTNNSENNNTNDAYNQQANTFTVTSSPPRSREGHHNGRSKANEAWYDPLLRMQLSSPLRRQAQQKYESDHQNNNNASNNNAFDDTNNHANIGGRSIKQERLYSAGDPNYNAHDLTEPVLTIPELRLLWRQLLMACIAIGILCTEKGGHLFDRGMECFTFCDTWLKDFDELVPLKKDRKEMKAYVQDAMAFYFFKRKRSLAARAFSEQAMALFREVENAEMEAQCLLHIASVQCQLSQFKESHATLYHFLAMVENGRLAFAQATPKQLCMVAVAYHNLAVIQLKLDAPDLACKSSQNARKIARLCLAQSNRWIDVFQYTHEVALADMKYELSTRTLDEMTPQQILLIRELAEALFAPDVVISG